MKLRRRRRVKAFPQKRSQLGGCGLLPENGVRGHAPPSAFGRAAASPQTRQMRCWLSAAQAAYHSFPSLPPTNALFTPAHSAFSAFLHGGWYHYPRRALHAVETLDARGSRRRIRRFYAVSEFAPCGQNIPSAGTHATPAPNRAHSGSHAETRGVLRVDGDDVLGSGIIDTIDPFQADQPVAVALAEGHRNAVSP